MKLININKSFGNVEVLKDFNIEFEKNEICCILGPSGCGKTTILNIISKLTSYEGTIENNEKDISYIFQSQRLLPNLTVKGNLDYVLASTEKNKKIREQKIYEILKLVELEEWGNAYPSQLSGGMGQRVAMARAFVYPSKLLLMDEPFKGLDFVLKNRLTNEFLQLWKRDKKTVVFVTHEIDEALLVASRVILLSKNAQILMDEKITLPTTQRDLTHKTINEIRKKIYSYIIK